MTTHQLSAAQQEIMDAGLLTSGFNCVLQMPTGSGKTWLAMQAIEDVLKRKQRAIYLTPLRALASELLPQWQQHFDQAKVGIFTGDFGVPGRRYPVAFGEADILIMTPERLDACTRNWRTHWHWLPEVDLIVVDEFHLLGDGQRGARLEGTLLRMRRLNPFARIVCLSATMGNRSELADWLGAVDYVSTQRPIPLDWQLLRYRKAEEKPALLADALIRNVESGGKSLVFVQSRRRAEILSRQLCELGMRANHHHAGLNHATRQQVEEDFRSQHTDVLVATSTLEMGINLPVRQVVLYDLQAFDGVDFGPLSTNVVWQRAGRAGRRGLDESGEVLLVAPNWDKEAARYRLANFEPIRSELNHARSLAEQVIAEVASGLARTESQLTVALSQSLAAHQQVLPDVGHIIEQMVEAGMICQRNSVEDAESEQQCPEPIFKATRLGRIAVRHFLAPEAVLRFKRVLDREIELTFLDLLIVAAASDDCQPVLPVDFEDLDGVASSLSSEPSTLLQLNRAALVDLLGIDGKRLLSAFNMALVMRSWTRQEDAECVAEEHNCYPFEIGRLVESTERLLLVLCAVYQPPKNDVESNEVPDEQSHPDPEYVSTLERAKALCQMVSAGLDETTVTLTFVPKLGPKLARRLSDAGIDDIEMLAQAEVEELLPIHGIGPTRAADWITAAEEIVVTRSALRLREEVDSAPMACSGWPNDVEPYRLRRALDLTVTHEQRDIYRVRGGLEPHTVRMTNAQPDCDCIDATKGHTCKHVLAVCLYTNDPKLTHLVARLQEQTTAQLDLFELWFS